MAHSPFIYSGTILTSSLTLHREGLIVLWVFYSLSVQANDFAVFINVYLLSGRMFRQTGHGAHIAAERINEARADAGPHLSDGKGKAGRRAFQRRLVAEAQMSFCHAHRKFPEAVGLVIADLPLGQRFITDPGSAVNS